MAKFDLHNKIHTVIAIPPTAALTNANTPYVSSIIDTRGYGSVEFVILSGTQTDANATFAVTMDEGDAANLSDASAVAAADLLGTYALAGFQFDDDNKTRKIGYVGNKRYVRLTVTPSGNDAGNAFVAAVAVLSHANLGPTANPPQ